MAGQAGVEVTPEKAPEREVAGDVSESAVLVMPTLVRHDLKSGDKILLEGVMLDENVYAKRLVGTVI